MRQQDMVPSHVGIFWLLLPDRRALIDATPLDEAEKHDRFLIHSASHVSTWKRWRREGKVPADSEYDGAGSPRGRVAFDWVSERFTLLADRRIIEDQVAMQEIMDRMGLPENTQVGTDPHYRTTLGVDPDDDDDL